MMVSVGGYANLTQQVSDGLGEIGCKLTFGIIRDVSLLCDLNNHRDTN